MKMMTAMMVMMSEEMRIFDLAVEQIQSHPEVAIILIFIAQ